MTQNRWIYIAAALAALAAPHARHYRFTMEYFTFDAKGHFVQKQRIVGDYTAAEPGDDVRWTHVRLANGDSLAGAYARDEPQTYMEGFSYSPARERVFAPEFFKSFPPTATQARNLVWDTFMFDTFVLDVNKVKAGSPYHVPVWEVPLAGTGTFTHRDIQLKWIGIVERNKQECALVRYEAFFNTVEHELPGMKLVGRSDYWGDMWIGLANGDLEYATLEEEVAGELQGASMPAPRVVNVVRRGTFERLSER
jgi:hypothetical protein